MSDIQVYFEYTIKEPQKATDYPPIRIYLNKIETSIKVKTKGEYYLKLFTPETIKLLGSTKSKIAKSENGEMCLI